MYAVLDIETTGGKYDEEGITEIAIYRFDGHKVDDQFISLINPEKEIQPFVVKLTGINNQMLRSAPKFYEVAKRIIEITEDCTLVAHNAQFDYRILQTEFRRLGYDYQRKSLCTVELSKELLPEQPSYSLGKLVRALGIPVSDRHRANGDAIATVKLFKLLLSKDVHKKIVQNNIRQEQVGQLNPRLIEIVERLPSETGVFYMYNIDGELIYLSKSSNIRKKVNKIFINSAPKNRKIQKEVRKVSFDLTGNVLIAQLKEIQESHGNKPRYNSKRKQKFTHALYLEKEDNSPLRLIVDKFDLDQTSILNFVNYNQAIKVQQEILTEFELHYNDNAAGQIGQQSLQNQDELKAYNKRVRKAIHQYSLSKGSFAIVDKGRSINEQSVILFIKDKLKGYGFFELNHQLNNLEILQSIITPIEDSKIVRYYIEQYLRKKPNLKIVQLETQKITH
ncbi:exonuclease domain-containing protein [Galbibacter sp.]|uniref:exonuclease domain-containing protein n=1 Tax=Galbibacter sp. TaxID=2918471 RepID=UPI002CB01BEB|nr:exonuclease domain-containing protein [Galbibacter sp.]HLV63263.1 exonuclease domain-containing protein [Galbibacter sp.]